MVINSSATSRAKAVGIWQFIQKTGKRYGLMINRSVDERRDPIRATEAAAKYLKDLYNAFNSWKLAIAAYNCGETRVLRAIMHTDTRNFWKIVETNLPRETRNYVPKFIAAAIIGRSPEKYGFSISNSIKYPDVDIVEIKSPTSLKDVAKLANITLKKLKNINPHLRKEYTPYNYKTYDIWVPSTNSVLLEKYKKQLKRLKGAKKNRKNMLFSGRYIVKRGDTLSGISARYKISMKQIIRSNKLRRLKIFVGQKLKIHNS